MKRFTIFMIVGLVFLMVTAITIAAPPLPADPIVDEAEQYLTQHEFRGQVRTGPDPWFTWYFYDAGWSPTPTNLQSDIWIQCQEVGIVFRVRTDADGAYHFRRWIPARITQCQMVAVTVDSWYTNLYTADLADETEHQQDMILHFGREFDNPFLTGLADGIPAIQSMEREQ